jgi:quinoprotein glucose dehydrogenase
MGLVAAPKDVSDMGYISGTAGQPPRARKGGTGAGAGADALTAAPAARPQENTANIPGARVGTTVQGMPMIKPPYGRLTAIDLNKGDFKWQIPFGPTPAVVSNNPALKGIKFPPTGETGLSVGTLVTKTLLIAGDGALSVTPSGARGANLHAYDKLTGNEVGSVYLPAPQSGSPMTYMLNGKQYIVVAVSGGAYSGEYIAFTLPSE